MKVHIATVKQYEFEGIWFDPKLEEGQLQAFNLLNAPGELEVQGDYHIEWDNDIPCVYLDGVYAYYNREWIPLDEDQISYNDIVSQIESKGDYVAWTDDRMAALADRINDSY